MTDREALIEKASLAFWESIFGGLEEGDVPGDVRRGVEVALTVFEEAWSHIHTVNVMREDWDRLKRIEEAHAKPLDISTEPVKNGGDSLHDEAHAPAGDERGTSWDCPRCGNDPEDCYCNDEDMIAFREAGGFRRPEVPEPQGDPTDAVGRFSFDGAEGIAFWVGDSDEEPTVKVMFSELMDLAKFLCDNFPGIFKAESDGAHLQAEPTDAMIEAALIAYWGGEKNTHLLGSMEGMRAALRATFRAGGEGR